MPSTVDCVNDLGIFLGDKPLSVKLQSVYIHTFFHTMIVPYAVLDFSTLHGDDRQLAFGIDRIINYDDPVGSVDFDAVNSHPAGKHQTIVSVEFGKLAAVDVQIHHNAAANRLVVVLTDEG